MISLKDGDREILIFVAESPYDINDGNLDVEVRLADGSRWGATFFTLRNIARFLEERRRDPTWPSGHYFWYADLVIVDDLAPDTIKRCVRSFIEKEELEEAFERLLDDE